MGARRQRGLSVAVVLVIIALVMVGMVAGLALTRLGRANDDSATTATRLVAVADTLEAFAASAHRLPCPADPTRDDGVEVPVVPALTCTFPEGTIPWKTIGLKRDDAFDAWQRKISYRVYTGNGAGDKSLVQAEGVSMVECDTVEPAPAATTGTGLCEPHANVYQRATPDTAFLDGKGMTLTDNNVVHTDVAYVLLSHGATGLGAYTASGARMEMPAGKERSNTDANGAFTIQAFSDADTPATSGQHFDDILVYRALPDLVKRIGLAARDWPEPTGGSTFTPANITAATGVTVASSGSTNLGVSSFTALGGVTVTGYTGSLVATNLTYDSQGGGGLGIASGSSLMSANDGEWLRIELGKTSRKLGLSLGDMGYFAQSGDTYVELVALRFVKAGTQVDLQLVGGCHPDGDLSHYELTAAADFDTVDVIPVQSVGVFTGTRLDSQVLVYEVLGCSAAASSCRTSVYSAPRAC